MKRTAVDGWKQILATHGSFLNTESMLERCVCHATGHAGLIITNDLEYKLEYDRPVNPHWQERIGGSILQGSPGLACNW